MSPNNGLLFLSVLVSGVQSFLTNSNGLTIYPHPHGPTASDKFSVYVSKGGQKHQSFTYISTSDHRTQDAKYVVIKGGRSVSWTSFAFSGLPVTVEVHTQKDFHNCIVRPKHYGYSCHRTGSKTAQFTVKSNNRMMSVEFDYDYGSAHADITDKLLVFADPPETDIPSKHDSSVLYYDAGIHNLNGVKTLDSHIKHVYLAPGAYLQGGIKASGNHQVKITGRGVISGTIYKFHDPRFEPAIVSLGKTPNCVVEGITIVDPPVYYLIADGDGSVVKNVKMVAGWTINTDGIGLGKNGLAEDTFVMANDDSVKLFADGITVRRCVIWQGQFGGVFQTGWWKARNLHKVRVSEIDIIHLDWCTFQDSHCHLTGNDAVLDLGGHTEGFQVSDVLFENIRIEGTCPRVVHFEVYHGAKGSVSDVRFNNWDIEHQDNRDSIHNTISGVSNVHLSKWSFTNFKVAGRCVSNPHDGDFVIDGHTADVTFHCH